MAMAECGHIHCAPCLAGNIIRAAPALYRCTHTEVGAARPCGRVVTGYHQGVIAAGSGGVHQQADRIERSRVVLGDGQPLEGVIACEEAGEFLSKSVDEQEAGCCITVLTRMRCVDGESTQLCRTSLLLEEGKCYSEQEQKRVLYILRMVHTCVLRGGHAFDGPSEPCRDLLEFINHAEQDASLGAQIVRTLCYGREERPSLDAVSDDKQKRDRLLGGQLIAEMVRNHIFVISQCVGAFRGFVAISFSIMSPVEFRRMLAEFGLVASLEWVQASLNRKSALLREARADDGEEGGLIFHGCDNVGMIASHGKRVEYAGMYEMKISQKVSPLALVWPAPDSANPQVETQPFLRPSFQLFET